MQQYNFNNDGFSDLVLGVGTDQPTRVGRVYVIFGSNQAWPESVDVATLDGENGLILMGETTEGYMGRTLANAGDINGDGIEDIIIGGYKAEVGTLTNAGRAFVVFGVQKVWPASMNLADMTSDQGFRLNGFEENLWAAQTVSAAGDVNGDGFDDFFVSGHRASPGGRIKAGQGYLIYGFKQ